ncbi:MAG: serine/threonine-protein kinase [Deltaproteobacteria bacterium]
MANDPNRLDDERLFAVLDRYVAALQAGDVERCARWQNEYPELRDLARCLETLDQFSAARAAPPPAGRLAKSTDASLAPTIVPSGTTVGIGEDNGGPPAADFGRFELLEEIGRGGMGVVFKARQRDLNRIVALKMILSNRLAGDDDVKRFYREARAAGSLRHPQIVGIHDVGQIHGQHFFAMDYIAGGSLAAVTKAGPVEPEQAARCLIGVARAVQFLHDHGIVHRDLKPSNILLDESGTPHVTDFGLAKVFGDQDERTQTGAILGTPGYMSPEQAAGRIGDVSPRSDVYSLGAILYEMLTGRPPFRDDNPLNTLLQVLESEPTLPRQLNAGIPPELERICLKCLEKDPGRRYPSAAAVADELDRFLRSEPIEAKQAGLAGRLRRWIRREPGLAARLGIMLAAMGVVETLYLVESGPWPHRSGIRISFSLWAALAFAFQWLLRREKTAGLARLAWAVTDPLLLLVVILQSPPHVGTLLIGYPVLIAASGLWFNVRLVTVSTTASIVSYLILLLKRDGVLLHEGDAGVLLLGQGELTTPWHYPLIFIAALAVIGFMVAFQVHRVRTLTRYFEQMRPPDA